MEEGKCYVCGTDTSGFCNGCGEALCDGCHSMEIANVCQDCSDEQSE